MPTKIKEVSPPRGLARLLFRLPIWLFRLHMGWLAGNRFLLLIHSGRKSGLPRRTVLEVLQYDKASDTYAVLSGWGEKADWLRNIEKTPEVTLHVGRRHFQARATRLTLDKAEEAILNYARRNPLAIRVLPRMMGYRIDGTEADVRALARLGIVITFVPTSSLLKEPS